MRAIQRLCGAAGVVAVIALAGVERDVSLFASQQTEGAGSAFISGRVIEGDRHTPVGGAVVTLQMVAAGGPIPDSSAPVLADGQGRFVFSGVPPGEYRLFAARAGWSGGVVGGRRPPTFSSTVFHVDTGVGAIVRVASAGRAVVTIPMWRIPVVSGRVTDARGQPMAGVRVGALRWAAISGRRRLVGHPDTTTDDRGRFTIVVPPGEVVIAAVPRGAGVLPVGTDPDSGQPIVVQRTFHPDASTSSAAAWLTLDYGDEHNGIDVRMPSRPAVRVRGVLRNVTGARRMPSRLEFVRDEDDPPASLAADVDPDGRFAFEHVPAGRYLLRTPVSTFSGRPASDDPDPWVRARLDVGDRDVEVTADLHGPLVLRGRIEFDGEPIPPAVSLMIWRLDDAEISSDVTVSQVLNVGDTRTFALHLPPGRYLVTGSRSFGTGEAGPPWWLRSSMLTGRDIVDEPVSIDRDVSGLVVTFTNRRPILRGHVTLDEGSPESAIVVAAPADETQWIDFGAGRRLAMTSPTRDGTFEMPHLPAGSYLVSAVRDAATWTLTNPAMLRALAGRARLVTLVEGQAHTETLRAIDGPVVAVASLPPSMRVDVADRAAVRDLPAREAPGRVTPVDGAVEPAEAGAPPVASGDDATGVTRAAMRAAAIEGTVRDHVGLPHADALVTVQAHRWQAGRRVLVAASEPVMTDVHGRYRVHGLAPGDYIVHVQALGLVAGRILLTTEADVQAAAPPATGDVPLPPRTRTEVSYVPIYHPGATEPADARPITLTPGDDLTIDFQFVATPSGL